VNSQASRVALRHLAEGPVQGPAVLLAGSLGTSLEMWSPQVPALLAAGRRVIRYDHRGHGGSPAPPGPYRLEELASDALGLLDLYEIQRADLIGISLGGMVGLWLAAHASERVERLVVIASSARPGAEAFRERARAVRHSGSTAGIAETVVRRWFTPAFAAANPETVAWMRAMIEATPAEGYASCCDAIAEMDERPHLSRITARTLVVGAAEDPALPPEQHSRPIADAIPGARYEVLERAAHIASVERSEQVNSLIAEHLPSGP
jgi:3-oxoadipate enol-lactonase